MTQRICFLFAVCFFIIVHPAGAQRIKLEEGSLNGLRNVQAFAVRFDYDHMTVSRKNIDEEKYVNEKIDDLNEHRRNQGDNWAAGWRRKRQELYEPAFISALEQAGFKAEKADHSNSPYLIIFRTTHTETGYNVGIKRRSARIDGEAMIVPADQPEKIIARISLKRCMGKTDDGYDFNTGQRLIGSYEAAGRSLGEFLKENH